MSLQDAIRGVSDASSVSVVRRIDYDSSTSLGKTWHTDGIGDHCHLVYGYYEEVPTMVTARNLVIDLRCVATAARDELAQVRADIDRRSANVDSRFKELGRAMANVSGLLSSIEELQRTLEASILNEQSSHRRFEQLSQSLIAAQVEIRELHSSIDSAIKKGIAAGAVAAASQIEEKGKAAVCSIVTNANEWQSKLNDLQAAALQFVQREMETKISEIRQSEVEQALCTLKKSLEVAGTEDLKQLVDGEKAELQLVIESGKDCINRLWQENEAYVRHQLTVDVNAHIHSMFRATGAGSTFWGRLKWLLTGKVS